MPPSWDPLSGVGIMGDLGDLDGSPALREARGLGATFIRSGPTVTELLVVLCGSMGCATLASMFEMLHIRALTTQVESTRRGQGSMGPEEPLLQRQEMSLKSKSGQT